MQGARILIIDDEDEVGDILSLRLGRRGFQTACARNGAQGLEYLRAQGADVVLLDMKMPGMDGLEVLRHIRADHPRTSVIILSGHADMDSAAQGLELGAFSYLLKPVDMETLCHKIEDARRQGSLDNANGKA